MTILEVRQEELAAAVDGSASLREIEAWLRAQQQVKSVEVADYLLKSNPPQREIIVVVDTLEGATATKVINIFQMPDGKLRFHKLCDR